jgi:hypothetical protein
MTLKAHFDGKVLVPDEPVDLPVNCALEVSVRPIVTVPTPADEAPVDEKGKTSLQKLAELLSQFPQNPDWPEDGAAQHDHYLYGTPKRP